MNDKYVKIECTLKEKILFLFTGIIDSKYLINNIQDAVYNVKPESVSIKEDVKMDDIPEKFDIPFFELDNSNESDIQSNL